MACTGLSKIDGVKLQTLYKKSNYDVTATVDNFLLYFANERKEKFYENRNDELLVSNINSKFPAILSKEKDFKVDHSFVMDRFNYLLEHNDVFAKDLGFKSTSTFEEDSQAINSKTKNLASYAELIQNAFKHNSTQMQLMLNQFKQRVYKEILVDFSTGRVTQSDDVNKHAQQLHLKMRAEAEVATANLKKAFGNLSPKELELKLNDPDNGDYVQDYITAVMGDNFDIIFTKLFGDTIRKNGKIYSVVSSTKVAAGWETRGDHADALEGMSDLLRLHIETTPILRVAPNSALTKDGSTPFTETGATMSISKFKQTIIKNRLSKGPATVKSVSEKLAKIVANNKTDREAAALYSRFYSPTPTTVLDKNGNETLRHSYYSMHLAKLAAGEDTSATEQILFHMTSNICNTTKIKYLNYTNQILSIVDQPSTPTKTRLMEGISLRVTNNLSEIMANVKRDVGENGQATISIKGKYHFDYVPIKNTTEGYWKSTRPLTSSEYSELFSYFGLDTSSIGTRSFLDAFNERFKDFTLLDNYISHMAIAVDMNQYSSDKDALRKRLDNENVPEKKIEEILQSVHQGEIITPIAWNTNSIDELRNTVDDVNSAIQVEMLLNSAGNLVPVYGMQTPIQNLHHRIEELTDMGDKTILHGNAFLGDDSEYELEETFGVKDGYQKDEKGDKVNHMLTDESDSADFNINGLFGRQLLDSGYKSIALDFFVPSDKSRYLVPFVRKTKGEFLPKALQKGTNKVILDEAGLMEEFHNTVGKYYVAMGKKSLEVWNEVLLRNNLAAAPFDSLKQLDAFLKQANIPTETLAHEALVLDHDYMGGKTMRIRPDMIAYSDIHASLEGTEHYMRHKLNQFVKQLSGDTSGAIEGETTGKGIKFKISPEINKAMAERFDPKWKNGDLQIDGEVNPFIFGYFMHNNTLGNNLLHLHQGSTLQYGLGKGAEVLDYPGLDGQIKELAKQGPSPVEQADAKSPIEQNFFNGYRPNSDVSKIHNFRDELVAKHGPRAGTLDLVKAGDRTRTTRTASWMKDNNPKVGDYFWQVSKKDPNDKVLTRITAVYPRSDSRFEGNWSKEGWVDSNFKYVDKYHSAVEFEVVTESSESQPEINLEPKDTFKVTPKNSVDKKASAKASVATKYIGFGDGIAKSSTEEYKQAILAQEGKVPASGKITTKDTPLVVYVDGSDIKGTGAIGFGVNTTIDDKDHSISGAFDTADLSSLEKDLGIKLDVSPSNGAMEFYGSLVAIRNTPKGEHIQIRQDLEGVQLWLLSGLMEHFSGQTFKSKAAYDKWYKALSEEQITELFDNIQGIIKLDQNLISKFNWDGRKGFYAADPAIKAIQAKAIKEVLSRAGEIEYQWVKGHSGEVGNEKVDGIAKSRDNFNSYKSLFKSGAGDAKSDIVNSGNYKVGDVVFASISGKRGLATQGEQVQKNINNTIAEVKKAIDAGAVVLTDPKDYTHTDSKTKEVGDVNMSYGEFLKSGYYNIGEKQLQNYLESRGVTYTEKLIDGHKVGVWNSKVSDTIQDAQSTSKVEVLNSKPIGTSTFMPDFNSEAIKGNDDNAMEVSLQEYFSQNENAKRALIESGTGKIYNDPEEGGQVDYWTANLPKLLTKLRTEFIKAEQKIPAIEKFYNSLDKAVSIAYTAQVKRAVAMVSPFYKPVLADTDQFGRPLNSARGIARTSNVAYFEDVKGDISSFFDGAFGKQDRYDGAFFMHPLEVAKIIHSFGGSISGLDSNILKDITSSFDNERGILSFEKKASFMMTLELMRNANGSTDFKALNNLMLSSIPFKPVIESKEYGIAGRFGNVTELIAALKNKYPDSKTDAELQGIATELANTNNAQIGEDGLIRPLVSYTKKGDKEPTIISKPMSNMLDVFNELGGLSNDNIWEEVAQIEDQNKDIAYQFIGKIGITSSVKTGASRINGSVDSVGGRVEALRYNESSNENTGLQQNPKHNPRDTSDALTIVTQKLQALALEGKMVSEVDGIFDAIYKLTTHNLEKKHLESANVEAWIKDILKGGIDPGESTFEKLSDPNWSLNDRDLYRKVFSNILKVYEKAGIRHKFNGGQFVVTPITEIWKVYDFKDESGTQRIMKQTDFDKYVATVNNPAFKEFLNNLQPRNIKGPTYYKIDPNTGKAIKDDLGNTVELTNQPIWKKLQGLHAIKSIASKDVVKASEAYLKLREEFPELPEITDWDVAEFDLKHEEYITRTLSELHNNTRLDFAEMLDSGEWYQRPMEVFMPNIFSEQYGFKADENISVSDVAEDPYFFLKRKLPKSVNIEKIIDNIKRKLITGGLAQEGQIGLDDLAFSIWVSAHDYQKPIYSDANEMAAFTEKYKDVIEEIAKSRYIRVRMKDTYNYDLMHLRKLPQHFEAAMVGDAARIPGTGMPSAGAIRIIGFMESLDNAIGVPIESLAIKGEDFDIDKANVQLLEVSSAPQEFGKVFDYYTMVGGKPVKNSLQGDIMDKDSMVEYAEKYPDSELAKDVLNNSIVYKRTDWWLMGAKNYITRMEGHVLRDGKNALASNRPVTTAESASFADKSNKDMYFSPHNPLSREFMSTINKVGGEMIGIGATALKGYSAIFHAFQKLTNRQGGKFKLDPLYLNGKVYDTIADTSQRTKLEAELKLASMSQMQRDQIQSKIQQEIRKQGSDKKAWAAYSELINAATDNAKLLILGRININPMTANLANTMLTYGVPLSEVLALVADPNFAAIIETVKESGETRLNMKQFSAQDSGGDTRIIEATFPTLDNLTREHGFTGNPEGHSDTEQRIQAFAEWLNAAGTFSDIATNLAINQGVKTSPEDFYKLEKKLNRAISRGKMQFSLRSFIAPELLVPPVDADGNYMPETLSEKRARKLELKQRRAEILKKVDKKKGAMNLLRVLSENAHFMGFYETMYLARTRADQATLIPAAADALIDSVLKITKKGDNNAYESIEIMHQAAQSFIMKILVDQHLQTLGPITAAGKEYNMRTLKGRESFLKDFGDIVDYLVKKNPGNGFLQRLKPIGNDFTGAKDEKFEVYSIGDLKKGMTEDNAEIYKNLLGALDAEDLRVLHIYSLLIDGGGSAKYSFASIMPKYIQESWNDTLKKFTAFPKVSPKMVLHFLDSNPMMYALTTYQELENVSMNVMDYDEAAMFEEEYGDENDGKETEMYAPDELHVKVFNKNTMKMEYLKWDPVQRSYRPIPVSMGDAFKGVPFLVTGNFKYFESNIATGDAPSQSKSDLDPLLTMNEAIKKNLDAVDPIIRRNSKHKDGATSITYLTRAQWKNRDMEKMRRPLREGKSVYVVAKEHVQLTNDKLRAEAWGEERSNATLIFPGEKLYNPINGDTIKVSDGVVQFQNKPVKFGEKGEIKFDALAFKGTSQGRAASYYIVDASTVSDETLEAFDKYIEGLQKNIEHQKSLGNTDKVKAAEDFLDKVQNNMLILNRNIQYTYAINVESIKNLTGVEHVTVNEDSIWRANPENRQRNLKLAEVYHPRFKTLEVYSPRANADGSIQVVPNVNNKAIDGIVEQSTKKASPLAVANTVEVFSKMIGEKFGIDVRIISNSDIEEDGDISNAFLDKDGFVVPEHREDGTVHNVVYINSSVATMETPGHEFAHLWVEVLKKTDKATYDKMMKLFAGHPVAARVAKETKLKGEQLQEEIFAQAVGEQIYKSFGLSNVVTGDVNEYLNKVMDMMDETFMAKAVEDAIPSGTNQDSAQIDMFSVGTGSIGSIMQLAMQHNPAVFKALQSTTRNQLDDLYGPMSTITRALKIKMDEHKSDIKKSKDCE